MKTDIFKNLTVTTALLVGLVGASSALAVNEDLVGGLVTGLSTDRDAKSGDAKEKVSLAELATLTLGDGQNIRFLLDPDTHEIAVQESGSINRDTELPLLMDARLQELDPLEIYLALTPRDRAVPRAIYEFSSSSEARASAAARALVESIEPMPAQVISYRHGQDDDAGFKPELCGANGAQEFQVLCNRGSGRSEPSCGRENHVWHQQTSDGRYRQSHGLAVACQAAVRTQHDLRLGGHKHTFDMPVSQHWHYTRIDGAVRSRRVVRMDRYSPTSPNTDVSYIRSWIGFSN